MRNGHQGRRDIGNILYTYIWKHVRKKTININEKNVIKLYPELVIRCGTGADILVQFLFFLHRSVAFSPHSDQYSESPSVKLFSEDFFKKAKCGDVVLVSVWICVPGLRGSKLNWV